MDLEIDYKVSLIAVNNIIVVTCCSKCHRLSLSLIVVTGITLITEPKILPSVTSQSVQGDPCGDTHPCVQHFVLLWVMWIQHRGLHTMSTMSNMNTTSDTTYYEYLTSCVYPDLKVVLLSCSVSGYDDNWSIEGWIQSKRRNRLGQHLETGQLLWDMEMVVEEPLSDDEDGVPDCDSHSECDLDSDCDSD